MTIVGALITWHRLARFLTRVRYRSVTRRRAHGMPCRAQTTIAPNRVDCSENARQSITWNARMYVSRLPMRMLVICGSSRCRKIGPQIGMSAEPCDGRGRWPSNIARI